MDSVLDFLFLRRLKFEYTSPPICPLTPASASGTGIQGQVISPILKMRTPSQSGRFLFWPCDAEQICFNVYFVQGDLLTEIATCISPNSMVVCSAGTWKIAPVYGTSEGPTTDPISAPGDTLVTLPLPAGPGVTGYDVYLDDNLVLAGTFCAAFETCNLGCYSISAITGDGETPISDPVCGVQPDIVISAPTAGETFYQCIPSVTVTADVTANTHTINSVEFFDGLTPIGTATTFPYSINWTGIAYGTHSLTAVLNYDGGATISSPTVNAVNVQQLTPTTEAWAELVVTNGGARPSDTTLCAVDAWYKGMVSSGLDSKMYWTNIGAPDSYIAQRTPFHHVVGTTFVDATFSYSALTHPEQGISIGSGGPGPAGDYIDTQVSPSSAFTATSVGLTLYAGGIGIPPFGHRIDAQFGAGDTTHAAYIYSTTISGFNLFQVAGITNPFPDPSLGFVSLNKTATDDLAFYAANGTTPFSRIAHSTVSSIAVPADGAHICFQNYVAAGFPAGYNTFNFVSFMAVHQGLSAADAETLFNLTQTLRIALGGGYG